MTESKIEAAKNIDKAFRKPKWQQRYALRPYDKKSLLHRTRHGLKYQAFNSILSVSKSFTGVNNQENLRQSKQGRRRQNKLTSYSRNKILLTFEFRSCCRNCWLYFSNCFHYIVVNVSVLNLMSIPSSVSLLGRHQTVVFSEFHRLSFKLIVEIQAILALINPLSLTSIASKTKLKKSG